MTITVFTLPNCVQCTMTKKKLDAKQVPYDTVDLTADHAAAERIRALGYLAAPVVIAGDEHWSGFRPDRIAALAG